MHILGYVGETLVAHAVLATRWVQPGNLPILRTAYIDAVATLPEYQGQGHGSELMRRSVVAADNAAFEICCLETEIAGFYEQVGWEVWQGELAGRAGDDLIFTPEYAGHILIHRLSRTPSLDLSSLLTVELQGRIW